MELSAAIGYRFSSVLEHFVNRERHLFGLWDLR